MLLTWTCFVYKSIHRSPVRFVRFGGGDEIQAPPIARWRFLGGKLVLSFFLGRTWLRFSDGAGCKFLHPKMLHKSACFGHGSASSAGRSLRDSCLELGKHEHLQWTGLYDQFPITKWSLKPVELKGAEFISAGCSQMLLYPLLQAEACDWVAMMLMAILQWLQF